ncbi:MAG TPA: SRPBCC family protein [Microthrixaceae bacterium]|nr:SRPBCC family protein [Microthrixaceae bacterium]
MLANRLGSAVIASRGDLEIVIERSFDAPAALVFEAWTTPSLIRRWWGYESQPLVVCDVDLRVGGGWRYVTRDDVTGVEMGWRGEYREIEPGVRIVSTECFEDHPAGETLNTLTLAEVDGVTTLTVVVLHTTRANRDAQLASGMERGLQHGLDRFERLITPASPPPTNAEERP